MPRFDDKHVTINNCTVVWDGITRPDKAPDGSPRYALKVVADPSNPDLPVHTEIATQCLNESKWRGQLPQGAYWACNPVKPGEFSDMFAGWTVINCKSSFVPDVYTEDLQKLDPMQFAQLLYPGQKVNVLVHCYDYDNVSKGVATGLDAIQIVTSANAPKLEIGTGGGPDATQAFGGQPAQPATPAPGPAAPPPPAAAPAPPPPAAAPAPPAQAHNFLPDAEPKYQAPDGNQYTEAQLTQAGWTAEQVHALPRV